MRLPAWDVERPEPRPGTAVVARDVQDRVGVDGSRIGDVAVVLRQSLGAAALRSNAPEIHLTRGRRAGREEERSSVRCPDRKMVVDTVMSANEDLPRIRAVGVSDEHRVGRVPRVIDQTPAVRRPGEVDDAIAEEGSDRSAHHRHRLEPSSGAASQPQLRPVGEESGRTQRRRQQRSFPSVRLRNSPLPI